MTLAEISNMAVTTMNVECIENIGGIERFFTLRHQAGVLFHPDYLDYNDKISQVIKPKLLSILDELLQIEVHDLFRPDSWFQSESEARDHLFSMSFSECYGFVTTP